MTDTTTPAALIRASLCSALCLLALHREAVTCSCPCGGAYHAKLADADIEVVAGLVPRPAAVLAGQMEFDLAGAAA